MKANAPFQRLCQGGSGYRGRGQSQAGALWAVRFQKYALNKTQAEIGTGEERGHAKV